MRKNVSMKYGRSALVARSLAVGGSVACASAALAVGPEVIYTKIPTHPSSIVPGALDLNGDPVVTNIRALEDLYFSPDGSTWAIKGRTQLGSDLETIVLKGSGTTGTMFLQEGQPVPAGAKNELIDFFGSGGGRFDDNNNFALSLRARGGVASVFQKVILWKDGVFSLPVQMGDLYAGLQDLAPNPSGDETVGNSVGSIHLLNNGIIGAQDSTILNISSTRRPAIFYTTDNAVRGGGVTFNAFKQVGVSTFLDIDGVTPRTYDTAASGLGSNSFYTTPDGSRWLVHADILGAPTISDAVLVVDGNAVLQENHPVGASTAVVHSFVTTDLISSGDWFARGLRRVVDTTSSNGAWAARNGVLIAQTGDPVEPALNGPSENWGTSFLTFTGNANGDWVLVGKTDNADLGLDDVVVHNGVVVLREGDPIDLDNNGQYDDDVFIGRGSNTSAAFETNDASLTNDNVLYIFVNLRDGQGNDLNSDPAFGAPQAFVRLDLGPKPQPCVADTNGDMVVDVTDLLSIINAWGDCPAPCPPQCDADTNDDCTVDVTDLLAVINGWGNCP